MTPCAFCDHDDPPMELEETATTLAKLARLIRRLTKGRTQP